MAECEPTTTHQQISELRQKHEELLQKRNELLETVSSGEVLKSKLRATRKDAKHLSKQKDGLRALADVEGSRSTNEEFGHSQEVLNWVTENQPPEESHFSTTPPSSPSNHVSPEDTFPPPPPPPPQVEVMSGQLSPGLPSSCFPSAPHVAECEALEARTEANALRLENENLVRVKRKLEEQVQSLVQELASLGAKYEELRGIAQRLEAENRNISQYAGLQYSGQQIMPVAQGEDMELIRTQLKVYEDDFKKEKSERENTNAQKIRLKEELNEAKATIITLQRQLKEALTGEGGYGGDDQLNPRGPNPRGPIINEPYYPYMPARYHPEYGVARTYSGGYIGPGATNDVIRRGHAQYHRKAFLSPDMTAVVDRDVTDAARKRSPKSI